MRKYVTEFATHMFCVNKTLLQQDGLEKLSELQETDNPAYHIYIIGRRPKIIFYPKEFVFTSKIVHGVFGINYKGLEKKISFNVPNFTEDYIVSMECDYPYTYYKFKDKHGKIIGHGKTAMQLTYMLKRSHPILDLEVLYIGQAYGKDGKRTAIDRLKSHSTLQSIYAESITQSPDMDIWIMLLEFEELSMAMIDGRKDQEFQTTDEEDTAHTKKCLSFNMSEKQKINFTEAALIKYFQPKYNSTYKNIFPNPAHSSYSECYDIEINQVIVEIQTDDIKTRLFSDKVNPCDFHFAQFDLYSPEDRKSMFDLSL